MISSSRTGIATPLGDRPETTVRSGVERFADLAVGRFGLGVQGRELLRAVETAVYYRTPLRALLKPPRHFASEESFASS